MSTRIIKKYPNRRLYDTEISSYITLEDVKNLVLKNTPIQVIDVRTNEDLTHSTLLQIIIDSEGKGPALFSNDCLQQMIQYYSEPMLQMQKMMRTMIDQSVSLMGQVPKQGGFNPLENNMQQWQSMQQKMMNTWMDQMKSMMPKEESTSSDEHKDHHASSKKPGSAPAA